MRSISFRVVHRTNDFRTDFLNPKLFQSLLPDLVSSLGYPAQQNRVGMMPLVLQTASRSARTSRSMIGGFLTAAMAGTP